MKIPELNWGLMGIHPLGCLSTMGRRGSPPSSAKVKIKIITKEDFDEITISYKKGDSMAEQGYRDLS